MPAAATAVEATGKLTINSTPWSNVTLDGEALGPTHVTREVQAGGHKVALETKDGTTYAREVTVPANGSELFCWDFELKAECNH